MTKLTYEFVKSFIDKENKLISTDYLSYKKLLLIECNKCNQVYSQSFGHYKQGYRHKNCPSRKLKSCYIKKKPKSQKICIFCLNEFEPKYSKQKLCNVECSKSYLSSEEMIEKRKSFGRKGGIISASIQIRRSRAEILFADMCIEYFGKDDVLCNELFFKDKNDRLWDADIIIKSIKTAVLYNGIWHYKQVNKKHNIEAVQSRDRIKQKIILDNNYNYFIVKDMGSFNQTFVKNQFYLFLHKLKYKNILNKIGL